jgi:hypothetical protein
VVVVANAVVSGSAGTVVLVVEVVLVVVEVASSPKGTSSGGISLNVSSPAGTPHPATTSAASAIVARSLMSSPLTTDVR